MDLRPLNGEVAKLLTRPQFKLLDLKQHLTGLWSLLSYGMYSLVRSLQRGALACERQKPVDDDDGMPTLGQPRLKRFANPAEDFSVACGHLVRCVDCRCCAFHRYVHCDRAERLCGGSRHHADAV